MDNQLTASSIGRRDILKKSAVVAATAWTAPMIMSSKVGASGGGTCDEAQCVNFYLVKIDVGGRCEDSFPNNSGFGAGSAESCQDRYEAQLAAHGITTAVVGGCSKVQVLTADGNTLQIKLAPHYEMKFALRKQSSGCPDVRTPSSTCDPSGTTYTYSGAEFSNMILVFCGPDPGTQIDARTAFQEPSEFESFGSLSTADSSMTATETTEAPVTETTVTETTEAPVTETTEAPVTETTVTETTEAPVTETTEAPVTETQVTETTVTETTQAPVTETTVTETTAATVPETTVPEGTLQP